MELLDGVDSHAERMSCGINVYFPHTLLTHTVIHILVDTTLFFSHDKDYYALK